LLTPDLRDWVAEDHLVHFVIDAIDAVDTLLAAVNERGTGSTQYPPVMLLALLVYSYATGVFSSRQIERSTYENVEVRLLCADTHPDQDTVCVFRRKNAALPARVFAQVLELAAGCGVRKVGSVTVAIDGTKVLANASKHASVSHGHAEQTLRELDLKIAELLAEPEQVVVTPLQDGLTIPEKVQRRQERKAKLARAKAEIEARAHARFCGRTGRLRPETSPLRSRPSPSPLPRIRSTSPTRKAASCRPKTAFSRPTTRRLEWTVNPG
jgi:transposase